MKKRQSTILERRYVPAGKQIIKQGDSGSSAYLVQSGRVDVMIESGENEAKLASLGTGQIFGEMSLITDEPRTATVRAAKDTNLIVISRQAFRGKLEKSDPMIRAVVKMFVKRLQSGNTAMFGKKVENTDFHEVVDEAYQNALSSLPRSDQSRFKKEVGSKLEEFLKALENFDKKEKKPSKPAKVFMDDDDFM